jgi:hypothetical protein
MNRRTVTLIATVVSVVVCTAMEVMVPAVKAMAVKPPPERIDCNCRPECSRGSQ